MLPNSLASTPSSSSSSSSIPTSAYAPASVTASPPHVPAPPLSPRSHLRNDSDNDDKDEVDDEDDEPFVLSAVTHPELPDVWVKVGGEGSNAYFVNYARAQSAWKLPEGLPIKM
jgi:hypothetical protein